MEKSNYQIRENKDDFSFLVENQEKLCYIFYMIIAICLIILGLITFSLGAGAIIYVKMFTRHDKPGIPPIPENFDGDEVEIKGVGNGGTHVHDPIIMIPLLDAKRRWAKYPLEKLCIIGEKGIKLSADLWLSEDFEKSSKIFAILVHGMTDSSSGMAYLAEEYHKLGINVLAVNVRSHGESYGKTYGMGYKDAKDILKWMELICGRFGQDCKFVLHGVSMGAATVLNTISLKKAKKTGYLDKVILTCADCGFGYWMNQLKEQTQESLGNNHFQRFMFYLIQSGLSFCSFITGNGFMENFSPAKHLSKATKKTGFNFPIFIFQGDADILVKPKAAQDIFDSIHNQKNKELILVKNAPHIGSYFYDKDLYMKKIRDELFEKA